LNTIILLAVLFVMIVILAVLTRRMGMIPAKKIVLSATLIAINVILTRFLAINTLFLKVNFSFIVLVVAALYLGPVYAGIINMIEDFIGPFVIAVGSFNPAFTITAFLRGLSYGLLLHPSSPVNKGLSRLGRGVARVLRVPEGRRNTFSLFFVSFVTGVVVNLVFSLVANSLILHYYWGVSYAVLIPPRVINVALMIPLHTVMIPLISSKLMPQLNRLKLA
jgi:ECF transporter S component (folate family)